MPPNEIRALGLDIGSVSLDVVVLDGAGAMLDGDYIRHHGCPDQTLIDTLEKLERAHSITHAAVTGTAAGRIASLLPACAVNEVLAQVAAASVLYPQARSIIDIGGQDGKYIQLESVREHGKPAVRLRDFSVSSTCAAGTGGFLDRQAARLGLQGEDELAAAALRSRHPARIAGRCSVFAKSDMIHLQQQGVPVEDIVAGLCRAMARGFKAGVVGAKSLDAPVALVGGVMFNAGVVKALAAVLGLTDGDLFSPPNFALTGAMGAAFFALRGQGEARLYVGLSALRRGLEQEPETRTLAPLRARRGGEAERPEPEPSASTDASDAAADLFRLPLRQKTGLFLGIDIGSISTNIVLLDQEKRLVAKYYLMTAGRPIEAVKTGFRDIIERYGDRAQVLAVGVTGSGRHLIGDLIGADVVVNEITAHAEAAVFIDPQVDTIFEIGGQDSKYVRLENGLVRDFTMNKACAAGTGSFLEEQAEKLAISVKKDFARLALAAEHPVDCGEQCAVFMDSEVVRHQQRGAPTGDIVAGLAYSIATNYLHRVVEKRPVGQRILFQGGVAFNAAVAAAFENLTGKNIVTPPHHEVMGAIGCCLLARRQQAATTGLTTGFTGFKVLERGYEQESFQCDHCANQCDISRIRVAGHQPLFYGGRCQRYETSRLRRVQGLRDFFAERDRLFMTAYMPGKGAGGRGVIGYPRILTFYEYYPFFLAFFSELGFAVLTSPPTNGEIARIGVSAVATTACFPTKVAHGHAAWMKTAIGEGRADWMFIPAVRETLPTAAAHPHANHCSYIQFIPDLLNEALQLEHSGVKFLCPALHFRLGKEHVRRELEKTAALLGVTSRAEVRRACRVAYETQARFRASRDQLGRQAFAELGEHGKAVVVVVGKAHNIHDPGVNMGLARLLRGMGAQAIPGDLLDLFHSPEVGEAWRNMTLAMGQRALAAADIIRRDPRLNAIYLTNFGCVNDSMYPRFFGREMGEKPFLTLEIDEHSAEAGVVTRCEAFLDAAANFKAVRPIMPRRIQRAEFDPDSDRVLYLPHAAHGMAVWAAALRAHGVNACVLPPPDERSLRWGRRLLDGKECLPCTLMTGDMARLILEDGADPAKVAFFMPGSCGSCRYDLFNPLQRIVFEDLGLGDVVLVDEYKGANRRLHAIMDGLSCGLLSWRGFIAADILEKLRLRTRPYELVFGETDRVCRACLENLVNVVEEKGAVEEVVIDMVQKIRAVAVDRSVFRPLIGLVGEAYLRNVEFAGNDIIRQVERLGGEICMPAIMEVLWYSLYKERYFHELANHRLQALLRRLQHGFLRRVERRMRRHSATVLSEPYEQSIWDTIAESGLNLDAGLGFGASLAMARRGARGIIHAIPFNCVPGAVIQGLEGRFRALFPNLPFMTICFSGQDDAGARVRLEALAHQCRDSAPKAARHEPVGRS
ncbi:MAG: acyl-CoA dehydratase activase [Desulfobulbaceae bacterium]|nr:acyl-CoA dehydratase activase [Desulfobulbaceae bacterium]